MIKTYKIAHINRQGQDIIIVPLESIDSLNHMERCVIGDALQFFATDAGLKGNVCLVWQTGDIFKYLAPSLWYSFFGSIDMDFVKANLNRTLTCSYQ
mgnify:CR=1 FL=1